MHNPDNGWPLVQLETAASVRSQAQPVVASHYGSYDYEMFDGCGGLSSAVIDVARLCAMFSCRTSNPVLAATTIDQMLAAAVNATNTQKGPDGKGSHGYHGFDWAANVNVANHEIQFSKGGWLPGQGTSYVGTTGGLFYVLAQNGNSRQDVTTKKWLDPIQPIAESHDWGTGDLFRASAWRRCGAADADEDRAGRVQIGPEATQEMVVESLVRTVALRIVRAQPERDSKACSSDASGPPTTRVLKMVR